MAFIDHSVSKVVATILAADDKGRDGAIDLLIEMASVDQNSISPSEASLLFICSDLAVLFAATLEGIAKNKEMDKADILRNLALAAMDA